MTAVERGPEEWTPGDVVSNRSGTLWIVREVRDPRHGLAAANGGLVVEVAHYANRSAVVSVTEIPGLPPRLRFVRHAETGD